MCTNYRTASPGDLQQAWGVEVPTGASWEPDVWPHRDGVLIRRPDGGRHGQRECRQARFGLVPANAKTDKLTWSTMNARIETAHKLFSFRRAWARQQWCILPAWSFYEPFYESATSRSVRWSIAHADGQMMGLAALWDRWLRPDGSELLSFAMLTRNCDEHPLLSRFHKWFDDDGKPNEKRTPVVLFEHEYDDFLGASTDELSARFSKLLHPDELTASPAPIARRGHGVPPAQ